MKKIALLFIGFFFLISCGDKDQPVLSSEKNIISFSLWIENQRFEAIVENGIISAKLPSDVNLTQLTPEIKISEKAIVSPQSGIVQDFSKDVIYTVTAEDKSTQTYTVSVTKEKQPPLEQVRLYEFRDYEDKKGGEDFWVVVTELNPIKEEMSVRIVGVSEPTLSYDLAIKEVDYKGKRIKVTLPQNYFCGVYYFIVTIAKGNSTKSTRYHYFNGGIPKFRYVENYGHYQIKASLPRVIITTGREFTAPVLNNHKKPKSYKYYLRKNGQDFQIKRKPDEYNTFFFTLTQELASSLAGTNLEFVIEEETGQKYVYPFVNTKKEPVEVDIIKKPIITSVSKTTINRGDEITIFGENIWYDENVYLIMEDRVANELKIVTNVIQGNRNQVTFKTSTEIPSGTYYIRFENLDTSLGGIHSDPYHTPIIVR